MPLFPRTRLTRSGALSTWSATLLIVALALGALSGCGGTQDTHDRVTVVASTNVWGSVARAVGGKRVTVVSLIESPSQDPHGFEASPEASLTVARASLVIENGGGYDDFVQQLVQAHNADVPVVTAVRQSGRDTGAEGFNEHVWYDVSTVARTARVIATRLGKVDPSHRQQYADNAKRFVKRIDGLRAMEQRKRATTAGKAIGITEPVPLYLTEALGVRDRTPEAFAEAVEEDNDVAPLVLQQTLDLYRRHHVSALVYNSQTTGPVTDQVLAAARHAGVPAVPVTETLPRGSDYVSWMRETINRVAAAVTT